MTDPVWLLSACPLLRHVPRVVLFCDPKEGAGRGLPADTPNFGQQGAAEELADLPNFTIHRVPVLDQYGSFHAKVRRQSDTHQSNTRRWQARATRPRPSQFLHNTNRNGFHTKLVLVGYAGGIRVCVHTSNLLHQQFNKKANACWCQDFPRKVGDPRAEPLARNRTLTAGLPLQDEAHRHSGGGSDFEHALVRYYQALEFKGVEYSLSRTRPDATDWLSGRTISKFDFSMATGALVASVPGPQRSWGRHVGAAAMRHWGHMRMRALLEKEVFPAKFKGSPLVAQYSSTGGVSEKWLAEFTQSLCGGRCAQAGGAGAGAVPRAAGEGGGGGGGGGGREAEGGGGGEDGGAMGPGPLQIIWPTAPEVRESLEGYAAGRSMPGSVQNVMREDPASAAHPHNATGSPQLLRWRSHLWGNARAAVAAGGSGGGGGSLPVAGADGAAPASEADAGLDYGGDRLRAMPHIKVRGPSRSRHKRTRAFPSHTNRMLCRHQELLPLPRCAAGCACRWVGRRRRRR